jgi:FkbH-like protein
MNLNMSNEKSDNKNKKDNQRQVLNEYLSSGNYIEAIKTLLSIIENGPSLTNYSLVTSKLKEIDLSAFGFHSAKIAILSSFTVESIIPYLYVECCRTRLDPKIYISGYNLYQQEIIDPNSWLYKFDPDVLILAVRLQDINSGFYDSFLQLTEEKIENDIHDIAETFRSLISSFRIRSNAVVIVHNFEIPARSSLGIIDNQQRYSQKACVQRINNSLEEIAKNSEGVYILDYDGLTSLYGKISWQDDRMWLLAKMPIAGKNLIHLANEYVRFLKPLKGLNRKCLVLDLDNTLWGGILGEDGIDSIKLGHTYPGNAFLAFQKMILEFYNKGIILAINSKNNETDVMEVFEKHSDMILKKNHFASWRINWQDKVQNMKEIAEELNIGLDSIAFIDDSPVERERMKTGLPEVFTIDMPSEPVKYCSVLSELTDFELLSFSDEDRKRGEMYRTQIERKVLQQNSVSLEDFYKNLEMTITINLADSHSIPRISQLTQRTNQFNLTSKRYSESDISYFVESPNYYVFYAKLLDKFGDNGIIGASIIRKISDDEWEIDTYLISCRALGRTIETAFLSFIANIAKIKGARFLHGIYIPTKKNQSASEFYKLHGFEVCKESSEQIRYLLDIDKANITFPQWFKLETNYGQK